MAQRHGTAHRRVLIVNAFFNEYRKTTGTPRRIPPSMAPVYLAGAFDRAACEVRIYNEELSGLLNDTTLLAWPDMLVLTGVTSAFDRFLHLTAYARTLNPKVIVVAGGPAVRSLPSRAKRFFDYVCLGDIEELQQVAEDAFGRGYIAAEMFPRYDLFSAQGPFHYVESSRYCNFRCSFCSLSGEGHRYQTYDLDFVRRQMLASRKSQIIFIDNNFFGNDRSFFRARIDMLRDMYRDGLFKGWSALVTADFYAKPENLEIIQDTGCMALFSGVESLDDDTLRSFNKRQNTRAPQLDIVRRCIEASVNFSYGIILDPTTRSLANLRREIETILSSTDTSLPSFFTLPIPLLGTPYFYDCVREGRLLPNVRLRDLDGVTVTMHCIDPLEEVVAFASGLTTLRGYRLQVLRHLSAFLRRYRRTLTPFQLYANAINAAVLISETAATSGGLRRKNEMTFLATTQPLGPEYRPIIRVPSAFEDHFRPTMVTDDTGGLVDDIGADLANGPPHQTAETTSESAA